MIRIFWLEPIACIFKAASVSSSPLLLLARNLETELLPDAVDSLSVYLPSFTVQSLQNLATTASAQPFRAL
jgi:hypothetical protein